jgi:hypothetical protein
MSRERKPGRLGTTVSRRGNVASTDKQEASACGLVGEEREDAVDLVGSADELLATVLSPGKIPSQRAVRGFLASDALERVLSLYSRAMLTDPEEPTYPWNLVQLDRLALYDLALTYLSRSVKQAEAIGDEEGADAHALLALANVAIGRRSSTWRSSRSSELAASTRRSLISAKDGVRPQVPGGQRSAAQVIPSRDR